MLLRTLPRLSTAAAAAAATSRQRRLHRAAATFGAAGAAVALTAAAAAAESEEKGDVATASQTASSWTSPTAWYHWLNGTGAAAAVAAATESAPGVAAFSTDFEDSVALGFEVTLYQYEPCPYCNKVRALLDYTNIPWNAVEVDPLSKPEIKFSEYKKVPILLVFGTDPDAADADAAAAAGQPAAARPPAEAAQQLNDSAHIMDALVARLPAHPDGVHRRPHAPADAAAQAVVAQWRGWVDDCLVHLLVANLYDTWDNALHAFDYLLTYGNFPSEFQQSLSRYSGALAMYALSHLKLNKKHGITQPREQIYRAVDEWIAAVGGDAFLGQSEAPTMADLSVYGVLRAVEGYPVFVDLMAHTRLEAWYARMKVAVGGSSMLSRV